MHWLLIVTFKNKIEYGSVEAETITEAERLFREKDRINRLMNHRSFRIVPSSNEKPITLSEAIGIARIN